jgi:hypothetical protein
MRIREINRIIAPMMVIFDPVNSLPKSNPSPNPAKMPMINPILFIGFSGLNKAFIFYFSFHLSEFENAMMRKTNPKATIP